MIEGWELRARAPGKEKAQFIHFVAEPPFVSLLRTEILPWLLLKFYHVVHSSRSMAATPPPFLSFSFSFFRFIKYAAAWRPPGCGGGGPFHPKV